MTGARTTPPRAIPRRPRVSWSLGVALAVLFSLLVLPSITADRWLGVLASVERSRPAPYTVRIAPFSGHDVETGHVEGGVLIARGEVADRATAAAARALEASLPKGRVPYAAFLLLVGVLAALFTHHARRSTYGRLLRVQLVSLCLLAVTAVVVKVVMLTTSVSVLVVPVALFAMVPTLALDRAVGLATGTLAALVVSLLVPFDVAVAVMLMVQAAAAGLVIAERPKRRGRPALFAGAATTLLTAVTYPLLRYLTTGALPVDELADPLHSAWLASAAGPALATLLSIVLVPAYQIAAGEITHDTLVELEDLSHPLLQQIAAKAPGTWQHSLMMANMAELAANAIGANGRLVRVGAYFHDLGKSLQPKYFIENLEPGETSPHDQLPPEVSTDAIFAHVTEGMAAARRAGLHERIIDFMHMHHGDGVLEYFWAKTREQGNPRGLTVEHFRYPGVPPQSRETAILSICDAVEAASRTLKKPEVSAIDNLVQRIVYGKLHLGQLDESGLSMSDLRRIAASLRDTIRHANHGRIEYPWQKAQQDASSSGALDKLTQTGPRLDSLDRPGRDEASGRRDVSAPIASPPDAARAVADPFATTAGVAPSGAIAPPTASVAPSGAIAPPAASVAPSGAIAPPPDTSGPLADPNVLPVDGTALGDSMAPLVDGAAPSDMAAPPADGAAASGNRDLPAADVATTTATTTTGEYAADDMVAAYFMRASEPEERASTGRWVNPDAQRPSGDVTRQQALEELDALRERAQERPTVRDLAPAGRGTHAASHSDDDDLAVAIAGTVAPRSAAVGVAKKPEE